MLAQAAEHGLAALLATLTQLAWVLGPPAACALALHQLERLSARALVDTFGWRSVLVTGWIGVPIHELGHVAACLLFMHEVEEVKLFSPDPESGTLGFVRHRAPAANPWAEIGRFFIGVAPLLAGSLALWAAARVLVPDAALGDLTASEAGSARQAFAHGVDAAASLLAPARWGDWRFWIFLYLALCIGAHLAPSPSDLRGALRGAVALLSLLLLLNLAAPAFGGVDPSTTHRAAALVAPVTALLVLATLLSAALLVLVLGATALVERARGARGHVGRYLTREWPRLVLLGGAGVAFAAAAGALP